MTSRRDRIAQKMMGCVHFTGVQHKTCKAGVSYDSLPKGRVFDACLSSVDGICASLQRRTREQAEAEVREEELAIERVMLCRSAITDRHGAETRVRGQIECPTNCGGTLRYSIASNGHIHAACSTQECARWME